MGQAVFQKSKKKGGKLFFIVVLEKQLSLTQLWNEVQTDNPAFKKKDVFEKSKVKEGKDYKISFNSMGLFPHS